MATLLILLGALVAASVVIVFARGWVMLKTDPPVPRYLVRAPARRRAPLPKDEKGPLSAILEGFGRPFAGMLGSFLGPDRVRRARRRIGAAGKANVLTPETYLARRAGAMLLFGLLGIGFLVVKQWLVGFLFIAMGLGWTDLHLWLLARKRTNEIEKQLPDFLDVLAVTVSAGLGFRRALSRVAETFPGPLSEEFGVALNQMDLGTTRRDAFRQLRDRSHSAPLAQLITAILQAEELGAPLSDALVDIAKDMRQNSAQLARRRAARTVPRIQLAITFLMVPAALMLFAGALLLTLFAGGGFSVLH